jgi:hypothetical protein
MKQQSLRRINLLISAQFEEISLRTPKKTGILSIQPLEIAQRVPLRASRMARLLLG